MPKVVLNQESKCLNVKILIGDHHKNKGILGEGGFGKVVSCHSQKRCQMEAMKMTKWSRVKILEKLSDVDTDGCGIMRSYKSFLSNNVICLCFEVLDQDLSSYLEGFKVGSRSWGLPLSDVKDITLHPSQLWTPCCQTA